MPNMILVNVFGLPSELHEYPMVDFASCIHVTMGDGLMTMSREERMINIIFVSNMLDKFIQPGNLISIEVRGFNYKIAEPYFQKQVQNLVNYIKEKVEAAGYICNYVDCRIYLPDSTESLTIGTMIAVPT